MQRVLWLVGLVGCVGGEQDGPPVDLELGGEFDTISYHHTSARPTAVGGIQTFTLRHAGTVPGIPGPPFEGPYRVEATDAHLDIEAQHDTSITARGLASGQGVLRFRYPGGSLIGEVSLAVADVQHIVLEPDSDFLPRDARAMAAHAVVWAPGEQQFKVGLYHDGEQLGDASLQVALAGGEQVGLDQIRVPDARVGTYPLSVTVGNLPPTTVDFEVVDHADSASLITDYDPAPTSLAPGGQTHLCFQARSAGRYIVHAGWAFALDGDHEPPEAHVNCVQVTPRQTSGVLTVTAEALGQSVSLTLPVIAM